LSGFAEGFVGKNGVARYSQKECLLYKQKIGWYRGSFQLSSLSKGMWAVFLLQKNASLLPNTN
jgi:hypothetical protein